MTINQAALNLIKEFEGFRAEAYRDPVGIWTIGFGTTAAANVGIVPKAGTRITEAEAEVYLRSAIAKTEAAIGPFARQPNENQRGAMVSLAYNVGAAAFNRSSVLRRFNAGDIAGAADAFMMWDKAGGHVLPGLVRRRAAERALFLTPDASEAPTPVQRAPVAPDATEYPERPNWLARMVAALFRR